MNNSYVIYKEACPECTKDGYDKTGDNLAVYNDGHKYCFRCHYIESNNAAYFRSFNEPVKQEHKRQDHLVSLPGDCSTDYTQQELDWMDKYNLSRNILLKHNVLHSDKGVRIRAGQVENVLIFPILDDGVQGYIARNFNPKFPKVISKGDMKNIFNILVGHKVLEESIVLVEDIVSAIKVSLAGYTCMPVYGSNVKNRFERLYKLGYRHVTLWLDPNMYSEMIRQSKYAHGLNTRIVFSDKDPKEHSFKEITNYLR